MAFRSCTDGRLWRTADEISGVGNAPGALVLGDLRIGAKRTRAIDFAAGTMRGNQSVRRFPLLYPLFESADFVEHVGPFTAAAVSHTGLQKQPHTARCLGCA